MLTGKVKIINTNVTHNNIIVACFPALDKPFPVVFFLLQSLTIIAVLHIIITTKGTYAFIKASIKYNIIL